jgi:septal ring factor EnvC (AmiA/AmiB activator)
MKPHSTHFFYTILIVALCFIGLWGAPYSSLIAYPLLNEKNSAPPKRTKQEIKKDLTHVKKHIQKVQAYLQSKQAQQSKTLKQLKSSEKKIATITKILQSTTQQLKTKKKKLKKLTAQKKKKQRQKKIQERQLGKQLKSAYINGKRPYIQLLLNQTHPTNLSRMLVYYRYMNRARTKRVHQLTDAFSQLKALNEIIEKEVNHLARLKKSQRNEAVQLKTLKKEKKVILTQLKKSIHLKSQELTELKNNKESLQKLINVVVNSVKEHPISHPLKGLKPLKGRLFWPLKGKHIQRFGSKKNGQKMTGTLIASKEGNDVLAIAKGRVVFSDWLRGFGLLLIIDHGEGYMSLYGYNQALYLEVGDALPSREVIAISGKNSGESKGSLYFELRYQGKSIDPRSWLKRIKG